MIGTVQATIDPMTDTGHVLPTCAARWSRLAVPGQAEATPYKPYWAAL